jgi:hypothetical protein
MCMSFDFRQSVAERGLFKFKGHRESSSRAPPEAPTDRCGDRSQTDGVGLRQVSSCALRRERKNLSAISAWHRAAADDDGRLHEKPVRGYEIVRPALAGACGHAMWKPECSQHVSPVPARFRAVLMNTLAFLNADTHRERTKPRESAARPGAQKTPRKRGFSMDARGGKTLERAALADDSSPCERAADTPCRAAAGVSVK